MLISADQLLAHAVGDYVLQSHWMATEKTKRSIAALCHVVMYGLPFLLLRPSVWAMAVILGTHFVIDRWRLARFVVWAKNWLKPPMAFQDVDPGSVTADKIRAHGSWANCSATGYPSDVPPWLAVWLLIIADNIMHIAINGLALKYF